MLTITSKASYDSLKTLKNVGEKYKELIARNKSEQNLQIKTILKFGQSTIIRVK